MYLKRYQERVVGELAHFFDVCSAKKEEMATILAAVPEEMRDKIPANWVENTFNDLDIPYNDKCQNGLGAYYPRSVIKVPTGGGKTLLAVEAIREYQTRFAKKPHGLVVWIVPSETIYTQIVSDRLGLEAETIRVVEGDTDKLSWGTGTGGARTATIAGTAVFKAVDKVVEKARRIAAHILETAEADIEFDDEEGDGQPSEYEEWQDFMGGDEHYDQSENGEW